MIVNVKPNLALLKEHKALELLGNAIIACIDENIGEINVREISFNIEGEDSDRLFVRKIIIKVENLDQASDISNYRADCPILGLINFQEILDVDFPPWNPKKPNGGFYDD
jgi:hypothetical protein